jgi:glycosyltransferase involved in cell wall biosynthesis
MAIVGLKILVLSGRLERAQYRRPMLSWLDRLEARGLTVQLLSFSAPEMASDDSRVLAIPSLARPWLRALATHWLLSDRRLNRPDLIHVFDDNMADLAIALAESMKIPYIQSVNRFRTIDRGLKMSRRWCRKIVAGSPELAADLVSVLGVPVEMLAVIPPGVVCPASPRNDLQGKEVPVIGTGGTVDPAAGFNVFLEAGRLILESGRDAEFILSAHGDEPLELRRLAQDLRIGERLTVVDDSFDGDEFWSVLDIYCQPSLSATAGLLLLSASAHGIPSIATRVKGAREMIEPGGIGLIVPPGDARALARAIVQLLDDPHAAHEIGVAAREFVRAHHDPEVEANQLAALYRSVLDRAS